MPVHDWSLVRAGRFHHFHDFHNSWIYKLSDRLNAGLLPEGFYAAGEQVLGDIEPDVLTFHSTEGPGELDPNLWHHRGGAVTVEEHLSPVSHVAEAETEAYLRKEDHVVIRAADSDRIVALIEIVSKGNKESRHRFDRLLRKLSSALSDGYHQLVIDLHPPGKFDPDGLHSVGVGEMLPDMPLFLAAGWYVTVPLEETYSAGLGGLSRALEGGPGISLSPPGLGEAI